MPDSVQSHGLQYARLPSPSLSPGVCSDSYPLMLSNHLILCCPLLLLPSVFPSTRVFSRESALHIRWPKYCSFCISAYSEYSGLIFILVQFSCSVMSDSFATPWTAAHQASLSITSSQSLLKLMSIESVMPSNYLIL